MEGVAREISEDGSQLKPQPKDGKSHKGTLEFGQALLVSVRKHFDVFQLKAYLFASTGPRPLVSGFKTKGGCLVPGPGCLLTDHDVYSEHLVWERGCGLGGCERGAAGRSAPAHVMPAFPAGVGSRGEEQRRGAHSGNPFPPLSLDRAGKC